VIDVAVAAAHSVVGRDGEVSVLIQQAIPLAISRRGVYGCYVLGGQLSVGCLYRGGVLTSFFREIRGLEMADDLWGRCRAYEQTMQRACCWYPHRDFLMVSERPREMHIELRNPYAPSGRASHRLHRSGGPAISWPDGWGVYAIHGCRVPSWVVEHPHRVTVQAIERARNAEVRRVMLDLYGREPYIKDSGDQVVDEVPADHEILGLRGARLLRKALSGESEPLVYLDMINSTPDPDGTHRHYLERIDPKAYDGEAGRSCHAAMASRWRYRHEDGRLMRTFERWQDYRPGAES
jgi:hypothetical protein